MRYEDENIWLTQKMMATFYGVDVRTINDHIKKIYSDCELSEDATIRKFRIFKPGAAKASHFDDESSAMSLIVRCLVR